MGLFHDLSKYSFTEFWNGAKYYSGIYSPNENERKKRGYSLAWMHHKGRNKHHFEYWTDIKNGYYQPVLIPIKYLKESLCDRLAASKIYLKKKYNSSSSYDYFMQKNTLEFMHELSGKVLMTWLLWIKELGEKTALKKIKKIKTYDDMKWDDNYEG